MVQKQNTLVPFSQSRVFITLILHLMIAIPSSFLPEENVVFWLTVNGVIAVVLAVINTILWTLHKEDSKRYFSLHSLVMMVGIAIFAIVPTFKALYGTAYFWILLIVLIAFVLFLFSKYEAIGRSFLDPSQKFFKNVIMIYAVLFLFIGGLLLMFMLATQTASWIMVAIIFFFGGLFMLMVSPAMLVKPEQANEFKLGRR